MSIVKVPVNKVQEEYLRTGVWPEKARPEQYGKTFAVCLRAVTEALKTSEYHVILWAYSHTTQHIAQQVVKVLQIIGHPYQFMPSRKKFLFRNGSTLLIEYKDHKDSERMLGYLFNLELED